ncbi:MAG TPA: DHA2 family efflux MFS transporter permease subunit [Solirubrobacteraceae bacterium]|nr:DHA2 family efflux MFS transporter permease subunit [Solirubrobacteraceae bacterium]
MVRAAFDGVERAGDPGVGSLETARKERDLISERSPAQQRQVLSPSRKRLTLVATILGSSIAILDGSVVSVALPSIQRSLGGGLAGQQWVSNAYLLTLGSLILLGGSLGDIFGERRVFALGVAGFGVCSLLCAVAPTIGLLVAFRALQGVAGALLTPSSLAVIVATFPQRERGPAIGTWTAWGTIAGALGPLVAGVILNVASWRWIFVINLPLVAACLWLILKAVPAASPAKTRRRVDVVGAVLCVLGLGGAVFALIEQPRLGWSNPAVAGSLIGGVLLFSAFLVYESRASDPMLRLDLFKSRNFAVGNVETLALYGGLSALFFFLVLYLQQVAGYTPLESGLALLPESLVMFALSSRFGALADRFGPRLFMGGGPLVAGAGMLLLLGFGVRVHYLTEVLPGILVFSLGLSITVAPLTAAILAGIDESEAGIGSAVNNAVARVAGLIATVAIGALVAAQFSSSLNNKLAGRPLTPGGRAAVAQAKALTFGRPSVAGLPPGEAAAITVATGQSSLEAFRVGVGVASGLVIIGGLIGAAGIRNPRRVVRASQCSGGQLAGAPLDAAGLHAPQAA